MTNSMRRLSRSCFRGAVLAAVCGALLVGCGGGSDDDDQAGNEMMPPTMEEMASGERARINRAIATARSAVGAVGDAATDAEVTAAENALSALKAAIDAASNVPEHEKAAHTTTHGVIAGDLMAAKMSREMAMDEAKEEEMAMEMAMAEETRATARKVFHAIERDREFDNTGGKATHLRLTRNLKGTAAGLNVDPVKLSLRHGIDPDAGDQSSTTSTANDRGNSATNNTYQPNEDVGIPVTEMLPALAGWKGNKYVSEHPDDPLTCAFAEGCMKGITDHVVIYHNQADGEDAEEQTFAQRYGADSDDDGTLDNAWYIPAVGVSPAYINNVGLTTTVANLPLIMADEFSTVGQKTHKGNDDGMVRVMGTFDGAPGTYTCTGTGTNVCTSDYKVGTSDNDTPPTGTPYIMLSGGATGTQWTFVPSNINAMVTPGDPTASRMFVTYGYWMRELSGDDGWTDVRPFSEIRQNSVAHANGVAQAIKGSATYMGSAAGMYAIYHPVAAGSSSGEWTANAMLTADFTEQMVSGKLTGFMAEGQAMDWTVELLEADINAATTPPDPATRARNANGNGGFKLDGSNHGFANAENGTVWTMGDMEGEKAGSWYGDFWVANDDGTLADSTTAANNPAPAAATGVFWAEYGDTAKMTGAFGVENDDN